MKRYAAYDRSNIPIHRVYANRPREALAKIHEHLMPGGRIWYVVEDPMAQITRGD